MSTIPERHVEYRDDVDIGRCNWDRDDWPCDAITEHRERDAAEQDAARLAEAIDLRLREPTATRAYEAMEAALRLHDERVKGGTT